MVSSLVRSATSKVSKCWKSFSLNCEASISGRKGDLPRLTALQIKTSFSSFLRPPPPKKTKTHTHTHTHTQEREGRTAGGAEWREDMSRSAGKVWKDSLVLVVVTEEKDRAKKCRN